MSNKIYIIWNNKEDYYFDVRKTLSEAERVCKDLNQTPKDNYTVKVFQEVNEEIDKFDLMQKIGGLRHELDHYNVDEDIILKEVQTFVCEINDIELQKLCLEHIKLTNNKYKLYIENEIQLDCSLDPLYELLDKIDNLIRNW